MSVTCVLESELPSMSFIDRIMSMWKKDDEFTLKIDVDMPTMENSDVFEGEFVYDAEVGSFQSETYDHGFWTGGVRYHGVYVIEVTLLDEDGEIASHTIVSRTI